ncbi:MAG: hypothetical protein ACREBG_17025 [Pyrinomonadaceae bacterium]
MKIRGMAKVMTMLALVASISVPALAGAVGGAKRGRFSVDASRTDSFTASFYGGELASVYVSGDGETDLDVYVYDAAGNLIAKDADYSDTCLVQWVPYWTGSFTIKVVNRGRVYNNYSIEWN